MSHYCRRGGKKVGGDGSWFCPWDRFILIITLICFINGSGVSGDSGRGSGRDSSWRGGSCWDVGGGRY